MIKKIIKKRFISIGLRSIIIFILGSIIITGFSVLVFSYDIFIALVFMIILIWLFISLTFMSFSTLVFTDDQIVIRGDFSLLGNQIQKRTKIFYDEIDSIQITEMKEHTNTDGETIKFTYKYGNERLIIYGLGRLKCIEIEGNNKTERIIINKYSKKQIIKIIEVLKNNSRIR